MRWFVTGDTHGDWRRIYRWIERMDFNTENINVIILGDAGLYWRNDLIDANAKIKYHEDNYKFNIYFIDGNHENFDKLKQLPVADDGIAHISDHIHYFPRGFAGYLTLDGSRRIKIATCGGADSIDKMFRTKHLTWWEDEQITLQDIMKIPEGEYDYVLTHCCPYKVFQEYAPYLITLTGINQDKVCHISEEMLDLLSYKIQFKHWYFGHYHLDMVLNEKYSCTLNDFHELA